MCTSKVWALTGWRVVRRAGMLTVSWKAVNYKKSNCKPQDTQDSWSGRPKYRLNSIKHTRCFSFAVVFGLLVSLSTGARKNRIFLLNTLDNVPRLKPSKGVHVMIICRSNGRLGRRCAELPYGTVLGKLFHWWTRGCVGNWVKIRPPKQSHDADRHNTDPVSSATSKEPIRCAYEKGTEQI